MAEELTTESEELDPFEDFYNAVIEAPFVREEEDGYVFDLGQDQEAIVGRDEFTFPPVFAVGDRKRLIVERPWGKFWAASIRKVEKLELWDRMEALAESGEVIPGKFVTSNRGGLSVDIGLRAFAPRSQVDVHRVEDFRPYLGSEGQFRVTEFDRKRCNVVVSQRAVLEEGLKEKRAEILKQLVPGQEFDGVIRSVVNFGAFVDIGGIEGLLHKTNLSWARIDDPTKVLKVGQPMRVVVLDYDPGANRLSLGHKQLQVDPWEALDTDLKEGDVVDGEVVSLADFGAFVALQDGLEGLVHVTEISWVDRVNHPKEVLKTGEKIKVQIIGIDGENRRLSLSIKQLLPNPWEQVASDFPAGTRVSGKVNGVTDFGVFVEIAPGVDGLVHVSDISWTEKIDKPGDRYNEGDEIEVVVLDVDAESARVSLGIKQLSGDPWDLAASVAVVGKKIDVTVARLTEFGAFVTIVEGVEGLIHISELSEDRVGSAAEVVKPGQTVEALVMSFDRANQRIGLSLKRDELDENEMREYIDEGSSTSTLGDILRDRLGLSEEE